ncbi:signal transduction superfamily protein with modified HD-GYP domain [Pseudoalteromonas atlantica]|jgi:HD-like signal output (HDOD) protein|uniref:Signal transduction superfamily protein with modified HD-GYP domain n=1 Tax=Pseudoalteromonas atlantica TaxID=288 RepID=A0ABQ0UHD3_PSEAF|nr:MULTISPECIES: HDOD domain-containing protein [unclassified Pseudoalteromonas]AZN31866.1 HDOD domain-containing protein [Pseudoalteromonas sp. Xi13]KPV90481.1 HDOD domain protein [Pseudoalteromonas sp. P1-30]GEK77646.1 signal transduction superfamily protein with modified HD-GYP domain [Pseudoalteromonas atlantica]|tara:strand:+ start:686 stop:1525 length:840 start_codon:yes stop_codon:yes gene_type:complete
MSTENALLTILVDRINNDTLVLPTLPEVAIKVRQAADNPDVNLMQMSDVIGQDPALSARMIKVANSAIMGRVVKVSNLQQAVTRIGLRQIKNIATAMAMEQLFVSNNELIKGYMSKAWQKTLNVAGHSITLMAFYLQNNKRTSLNSDSITLASLVYNIGVLPILTEAERHPEVFANPSFLAHAIQKLSGKIGGSIMGAWEFPPEFVNVARHWADPTYRPEEIGYVDFIRIGAILEGTLQVSDKSAALQTYIDKGVIPSMQLFSSDEYNDMLENVKDTFS